MNLNSIKMNISPFQKILIEVIIFCLFCSIGLYLKNRPGDRYVFAFESMDKNGLWTEERWMPLNTELSKDEFVTEELLLGSQTYRFRPLFKNGTKALFNYRDGDSIYINLSENAAMQDESASTTQKACELMQFNIKHLVRGIKNVTIFIAGHEIPNKVS